MTTALFPAQFISVSAESGISYIHRYWDSNTKEVKSETRYCTDYVGTYGITSTLSGWYVINISGSIEDRLTVNGTANLILCDNVTLECLDGINVPSGATLNIYGQSGGTGELKAIADTNHVAAIGGNDRESNGTINIYGGKVTATADVDAAGIGSGDDAHAGNINIYGGTVNATGGSTSSDGGAGIGGSYGGNCENLEINITGCEGLYASSDYLSAGIGSGGNVGNSGASITISGGKGITVQGGREGAGIGGGIGSISGKIKITGGEITTNGGRGGAGIGTGFGCDIKNNTDITINGGTITACGGYDYSPEDDLRHEFGAGIGAGGLCYESSDGDIDEQSYFDGNIYLNGGNITVKNVGYTSIGTTNNAALDGVSGNVYFNGATVVMGDKEYNFFLAYSPVGSQQAVRASNIYYKDNYQRVSYRDNKDDEMTPVKMSDRTGILTLQEHERVIVEPCPHDHRSYVNNGTNHSWSCNDCATALDAEDHAYGDPVWNWADDLSAATAVFLCPCGYSFNIQTTSIEVKDYLHKNVYVANVEYSGKTYTNTVEVAKSDIVITNESDWGEFIQTINDGATFAGQTITLTNDISVTTMAGTDTHKFMGTFEGGGHTITFNYTADENRAAPFRYVDGATFKNLKVTGTITTSASNAAGFVADTRGTTTFDSCWSNIAIVSTVKGDGTHGGLAARADYASSNTVFINCLFDGSITGSQTNHCGVLLGWPYDKTVSFTNCLNIGTFTTKTTGCGTFSRVYDSSKLTITNSYYKTAYGTEQGTQTYATGNELKALLGDGWVIYGSKAVPKCFTTTPCYTVTWKNDNGEVIDTTEVEEGTVPTHANPVKADNAYYTYTFTGWTPEVVAVTGDAEYTATFDSELLSVAAAAEYSISLVGDVGVNFYMDLSDDIVKSPTAKIHFTIPTGTGSTSQEIYVKDAPKVASGNKNYYVFECQAAAKEMTSEIKAQIIDGDTASDDFTYSVTNYANYVLTHADASGTDEQKDFAKAVPMVKAMLNYGAYSQLYFDKNTGNLANATLDEADKVLGNITINISDPVFNSLPDGTTFEGATLSLKSETTLSLYFKSSDTLEFACDGYDVEKATSGDYQIARIRGIKAKHIGDTFTLKVNGINAVTYSPLNYCKNVIEDDTQNENLKNVAKALYLYWQAADSYFID